MKNKYTISAAGGKPDSPDLIGCKIEQLDDETWEFKSGSTVLATSSSTPPSFSFNNFPAPSGPDWTVTVTSPIEASQISGNWSNTDLRPGSPDESDNFTATGTGLGEGEEEDEARAASGSY
jgi:hypothetical protein